MSAREPARLQRRRISGRRAHGPTDGTAGSAAVVDRCEAAFASPFLYSLLRPICSQQYGVGLTKGRWTQSVLRS